MANRIQLRRDTAANWTRVNPVLEDGEPGLEIDTNRVKYGDGNTVWTGLAYATTSGSTLVNGSNTVSLESTGALTLPNGSTIGSDNGFSGVPITTDRGTILLGNSPEIGLADHFHIMKGGQQALDLFLGDDYDYVKLPWGGGVEIASQGNSTQYSWTFGTDGTLTLPTDGNINFANGVSILSNLAASTGDITFSGSDITGLGTNVTITADTTDYVFYSNGTTTFPATGNITAGNLTITGNIDQPNRGFNNIPGTDLYITAGHTQGCSRPGGDTIISGGLGYNGIAHNGGNVTLRTGDYYSKQWNFDYAGSLTLPGATAGETIATQSGYITVGNLLIGQGGALFNSNNDSWALYGNISDPGTAIFIPSNADAGNGIPLYIESQQSNVEIRSGSSTWNFGNTGNLALPAGGVISEGGGISGAIRLTPAGGGNANQALLIYPTGNAEGDHVHLTAGGGSTELYLGNDFHYVKLVDGGNIELRSTTANLSAQASWNFDTTGNIDARQALGIKVPDGVPTNVAIINSTTGSWEANPRADLATTGGSGSGLTVNVTETGGYASTIEIATAGTGYTNGDLITVTSGTSNATFTIVMAGRNTWRFGEDGTLTFPSNLIIGSNPLNPGTVIYQADAEITMATIGNAATYIGWSEFGFEPGNIALAAFNDTTGAVAIQTGATTGPEAFNEWIFDGTGNLTLPAGGSIFNSSGEPYVNGVTSISTSVSTLTVSDASGDYSYGALSYDYAVNGVTSGGFTISYSAPLVYGNVDISVGNVTTSGTANVANLIVSGPAPSTLSGSAGDRAGMVRVDSNYIYYCTSTFASNVYTVGWSGAVNNTLFITQGAYPTPQVGWIVTHVGNNFTIDTVTDDGYGSWQITWVGTAYGSPNGGTATLTNPATLPAIWKTVPLSAFQTAANATNKLTNGGSEVALQANGVTTFGNTATISNNGEFRLWADNDITVYRNGQDGYGVKAGSVEIFTNNGQRTVITSAGLEIKTGNLIIPNDKAVVFANGVNILSDVVSKTTGTWTVTTGTNTYSFTVPLSGTYQLWVDCNIPNGIIAYNATATVTNSNVPVVGAQYAWVYDGGGTPIDFTSIPNQFVGTANTIVRSSSSPGITTNRFDFGINNTSGGNVTVRYGYIKIS